MALSGTLDSFALPDVLRLLASTHKTGRLRVTGDLGSGSVWVDNGDVLATELSSRGSKDPGHVEVVFGLLRFGAGSFTFEAGVGPNSSASPDLLEPILTAAEQMLVEWHAIEEVVASLDVFVELASDPSGGDVMIDANRWRCISAVGGGATVGQVGEAMELSELDVCRTVKELIELGLLDIVDAPTSYGSSSDPSSDTSSDSGYISADASYDAATSAPDPAEAAHVAAEDAVEDFAIDPSSYGAPSEPVSEPVSEPASAPVDEPAFAQMAEPAEAEQFDAADPGPDPGLVDEVLQDAGLVAETDVDPVEHIAGGLGLEEFGLDNMTNGNLVSTTPGLAGLDQRADAPSDFATSDLAPSDMAPNEIAPAGTDMFGAATADEAAESDLDPAEMARQLANLSPKAAKAVAAAARASTEEERDEALAAVEAEDDTVNRGLLLKFLGSVDS